LLLFLLFSLNLPAFAQEMPEEANKYYERGQREYNQGNYQQAQQDYKKALTIISTSGQQGTPVEKEVQTKYQGAASAASSGQTKDITPLPATENKTEAQKKFHYIIDIGDTLFITVWQEDLSQEVLVRPDGMISFPLVGDAQAAGLTIPELNAEITQKLQEYIRYPQVSVLLRKFGVLSSRVMVLGQVSFPGIFISGPRPTVLEAISLAGGFTDNAVISSVIVIKGGQDKPEAIRLNMNRAILKADMSQNIVLGPQDIVYVPKNFIANINYFISQVIAPLTSGGTNSLVLEKLRDAKW
jgi:polysaccharide export outer membrane protein